LANLFGGQPKTEKVFVPHLVPDFNVCPVQGAQGQRSVHGEFHIPSAGGLLPGSGNLFRKLRGRIDSLGVLHVEVGQKHHPQPGSHPGIMVHHLSHRSDQLDDQFGHGITRRRLAAKNESARGNIQAWIFDQTVIQSDDMQRV
jgi:hypothetical protein